MMVNLTLFAATETKWEWETDGTVRKQITVL